MGIRTRLLPSAALLLVLGAAPGFAAPEGGEGKATLALAPGEPVAFLLKAELVPGAEGVPGGRRKEARRGRRWTEERSLEILGPAEGGGFRAMLRFGRIKAVIDDAPGDLKELHSDRAIPQAASSRLKAWGAGLIAHGGAELPLILDPGGVPKSIEVPTTLPQARERTLKLREDDLGLLVTHLTEKALLDLAHHAMAGVPLPTMPVGPGDSWKAAPVPLESDTGRDFLLVQTFRVATVEKGAILLEGEGTVEARPFEIPPGERGEELRKILGDPPRIKESKASTKTRLSRTDGLPLSGSGEAVWTSEWKFRDSQEIHTSRFRLGWTLERVGEWPSGKPVRGRRPAGGGGK